MTAAALRNLPRAPFLPPVEALQERADELAHVRQELRASGAGADALERNRLALVAAHRDLCRALIARHLLPA